MCQFESLTEWPRQKDQNAGIDVPNIRFCLAKLNTEKCQAQRHERRCSSWEANCSKASL